MHETPGAAHAWIGGVRRLEDPSGGESVFLAVLGDAATGQVLPPGSGPTREKALEEVCAWLEQMPPDVATGALEVDAKDFANAAAGRWPGMVRVVGPREDVEAMLDALVEEALGGGPPAPEGLTSMRAIDGVDDADLHDLFAKALLFAATEVWAHVPSGSILELLEPAPPAGLGCFTVMGAGGAPHGLTFFESVEHAKRAYAAKSPEEAQAASPDGMTGFHLDPVSKAAESDLALLDEPGLEPVPVDGRPCVPSVYRVGFDGSASRPPAALVKLLPDLLEALAVIATRATHGEGVTAFSTEVHAEHLHVRMKAHYVGD